MCLKIVTPKIAFIDDGINLNSVSEVIPFEYIIVDDKGVRATNPPNGFSHGDMCYLEFCKHVLTPFNLVSVRVLDSESGQGTVTNLVKALAWCKGQDIDLINMSMGTRQYIDFAYVSDAIDKLGDTVIVAACSNNNTLTYPACLPNVIGVRSYNMERIKGKFAYATNPYDQIDVIAYSESNTNSMATPAVSAYVCNYLAQGYKSVEEMRRKLQKETIQDSSFFTYEFYKNLLPDWEDVQVPIVGFFDSTTEATKKMESLLMLFIEDGYTAICLSTKQNTNLEKFIIHLPQQDVGANISDLIMLRYNFAMPDIMFLRMDDKQASFIPNSMKPDIVITKDMFVDVKKLFGKLKEFLS